MTKNYYILSNINPIILSLGPISIRWYGIMYFLGFFIAIFLANYRISQYMRSFNKETMKYLLYNVFFGVLIGGRIGYILFYNPLFLLEDPLILFKIWHGGMSFHGGLIGAIIVIKCFANKKGMNFFHISDFIAPLVPLGLGLGRLGNFINGELWGRVSINTPWAMLFPGSKNLDSVMLLTNPKLETVFSYYGMLPRHPSQLYEMILEGLFLFIILNVFICYPHPTGSISGLFLFFYGLFRIIAECFREPDSQIGLFMHTITMGQILSLPMFIIGIIILLRVYYFK